MIKKVIFDMDGLIFDSERIFMRELGEVMKSYGYEVTEEKYVQTLGLAGTALENKSKSLYGEDYPFYKLSRLARERVDAIALKGELTVKKGIRELLEYLNDNNITCSAASSSHKSCVENYLTLAGLRKYFGTVIGGDMIKNCKPAPDIFLAALEGTPCGEAIVLEDSTNGIRAGVAANIPVICIPDMIYPSEEIQGITAMTANSALDVIDYIKEKNS